MAGRLTKERRRAVVRELIERDGKVCAHSGCRATEDLTIEHRIPQCMGGTNDLSNLELLCRPHNHKKSKQDQQAAIRAGFVPIENRPKGSPPVQPSGLTKAQRRNRQRRRQRERIRALTAGATGPTLMV